jgi:hypothetical protein
VNSKKAERGYSPGKPVSDTDHERERVGIKKKERKSGKAKA